MTTPTTTPRIEGSGQTTDYVEHFFLGQGRNKHVLRILIHTDSHADQAFGRVERWDGTQWRGVANVRGDSLKIDRQIGYARRGMSDKDFRAAYVADRNLLVSLAEEVLS